MAKFYAKNKMVPVGWARIKPDGTLVWSKQDSATEFADAESARAATSAAIKSAYDKRYAGVAEPQANWWDAPGWMHPIAKRQSDGKDYSEDAALTIFTIDAAATLDEALGVFEVFYVRSSAGWLGGPKTKASWGHHAWHESFSRAEPFASRESARETGQKALKDYWSSGATSFSVLKAASVFTEAQLPEKEVADDVARAVSTACEAREIEAAIREAGAARLADRDAMLEVKAPEEPRKSKSL